MINGIHKPGFVSALQVPSNTGKLALFLLNLFISMHPVSAYQSDDFNTEEVTVAQRQMIQKLSGDAPIREGVYLSARSSASERAEVANFLYSAMGRDGLVPQKHEYKVSNKLFVLDLFFDPYIGTNVYTMIPATTDSKEYVVLGAHYDSEPGSPGANDNATGVALVYQVAKKLRKLSHRERNFIVVFFDQEEDELIGSRAFAKKLKKEGKCVHSVHTIDMAGWDNDGDRAVELEYPTEALNALYSREARQLNIPVHETLVNSSDHAAFREAGFSALGISEEYINGDTTPHFHKPTDTADTVDYKYLVSTTQLVWQVMKALADNSPNSEL